MKTFKHLKFLAVATFGILFSSVASGQIITQYVGGTTGMQAIELMNTTGSVLTVTGGASSNLEISENKYTGNPKTTEWVPTNGFSWGINEVIVVYGASVPAEFINYLTRIGVRSFSSSLTLADKHPVRVTFNGAVTDMLGDYNNNNAQGFLVSNKTNADDISWEREFEFLLTTGLSAGTVTTGSTAPANAAAFDQVYGPIVQAANFGAPWTDDDFEGWGIQPGNIRFTDNGGTKEWQKIDMSTGVIATSSTMPICTDKCVIQIETSDLSGSVEIASTTTPGSVVLLEGQSVILRANASGQSKAKVKKRKGNGGASNPQVTQERYFLTEGAHFLGAPGSEGYTSTSITGSQGSNPRSWYWGPSGGSMTWIQATPPVGIGMLVYVNSGSGAYATQSSTYSVTGTPLESFEWNTNGNGDAQLYDLSDGFSTTGNEDGWNLLSNPFNCDLDFQALWDDNATSGITSTVYIWDPQFPGWIQYNAANGTGNISNGIIPPMSGFQVQIDPAAGGVASINANIIDHGSTSSAVNSYNKSYSGPDILDVKIYPTNNPMMYDKTWVSDYQNASAGHDDFIDSWKKINSNGRPAIYQTNNTGDISSNNVDLTMPQSIPLGLDKLNGGTLYSIELSQKISGNEYHVAIEDSELNMIVDLSSGPYTFQSSGEGELENRFVLHINQNSVSITEDLDVEKVYAYSMDGCLYVNTNGLKVENISVYSINGQLVHQAHNVEGIQNLCVLKSGIYLIEFDSNQGTVRKKLVH